MPEHAPRATVLSSLNEALHALMVADERVVVIGEDLLDPYGGAFKVTRGLSSRFPERVITTPVSEAAIVGVATGLALRGFRPVAEIMFGDFMMLAADQLINSAAKFRWMFNDAVRVPLVVRTPMGGRRGYGPTHSQHLEKHFLGVPGLWVVAPHVAANPGAVLGQAVTDCDDPVLFVEGKTCYSRPLVEQVSGATIERLRSGEAPFETTLMRRETAADGVLFCYGGAVSLALEAIEILAQREALSLDVAALTQLSPIPIDHLRRILSDRRPQLCVFLEEGNVSGGWAAELIASIDSLAETLPPGGRPRYLRIAAADTPVPASRELERRVYPQTADIVRRIVNCF